MTQLNLEQSTAAPVRLQKALASAGIASRRACETLIAAGRVQVNGEIVWEMGTRINPACDQVRVDGAVVQLDTSRKYYVLNKPVGVVSTMQDERGRTDLRVFTQPLPGRVYNVGRLDSDTSGLLILTNDGELAHKLAHPKFGVEKTYVASVRGKVTAHTLQLLKNGIELEDGFIQADRAKLLATSGTGGSVVELTLHSGRNRIVRRMLKAVGHPVLALHRKQFGPLSLGSLETGQLRELSQAEQVALLTAADTATTGAKPHKITAGRPGDGAGARGLKGVAKAKPRANATIKLATSNRKPGAR